MLGLHVLRLLQALTLVAAATAEGGRITIRPGGSIIVAGGQAADATSNDTSGASSAELEALKSRVASLEAAQTTAQAAQENAQTTIDALSEQYHLLKREIEALKNITEGLIPPPAFPPPPSPPSCLNGGLTLHNPTWTSNINNAAGCMSPAGCMIRAIPAVETTSFGSACVYTLNAAEVVDTGVTASAAAMRTIAFWAHITKDDYGGYRGEMVAKSVSNQGKEILVRDNKIFCYVMGGAGTNAGWALDSDARWYHVACVHDESADVFTLYIDGVAVATGTQPASVGNPSTTNLLIGNWAGSGNRLFKGKVGDVQVFDRPLSEAEVAALASP